MTPARPRPLLGVLLMLAVVTCFAGMDTAIRYGGGRQLPVLLMLWGRYLFQAVLMLAWLGLWRLRHPQAPGFATRHPRFQALRGALLLFTSGMSFYGLQWLPVAEFTAIHMLTPVLVTLLAALVLHEPVSRLRWALVIGAFAGALVVIRPGSGLYGWAVAFPLIGAMSYASFQVLTSRLASLESPFTTHFYTGAVGAVLLVPVVLASGLDPLATLRAAPMADLGLLLLIGALGTFGHLMLILALGLAPSATLMPFVYAQIGAAALLGWLVFDRLPDGWAWVGFGLITACGAASAWLNLRAAQAAHRPVDTVTSDTLAD